MPDYDKKSVREMLAGHVKLEDVLPQRSLACWDRAART